MQTPTRSWRSTTAALETSRLAFSATIQLLLSRQYCLMTIKLWFRIDDTRWMSIPGHPCQWRRSLCSRPAEMVAHSGFERCKDNDIICKPLVDRQFRCSWAGSGAGQRPSKPKLWPGHRLYLAWPSLFWAGLAFGGRAMHITTANGFTIRAPWWLLQG
jgi:hypothetical protein